MPINKIHILGVEKQPSNVRVDGNNVKFEYDKSLQKLEIASSGLDIGKELKVIWQ
jgi:hypothetical protein